MTAMASRSKYNENNLLPMLRKAAQDFGDSALNSSVDYFFQAGGLIFKA